MDWSPQVDAEETWMRERRQPSLVLTLEVQSILLSVVVATDVVLIKDALYWLEFVLFPVG